MNNTIYKRLLIYTFITFNIICGMSVFAIEDKDAHTELFKTVEIKDGSNLNIIECVALAFHNSPKIKRKKYALDIAKSNVGVAKSAFFPVIGAGVGFYNENNSNNRVFSRHYMELPNIGVTINQLVWDFGKSTANIKMEDFYKIGAEYEFIDSLCSTIFEVKRKYYDVLKAHANLVIAKDNVEICRKYLKMAKGSPDKATASFHLGRALFEMNYAETLYKNAKVNLSNAMYIDNSINYNISNTRTFDYKHDYGYENHLIPPRFIPHPLNVSRANAVDIAYANSPDLRVLESTRDAMIQALKYIKKTYFPDLTANVGYVYDNSNEYSNNNLRVGVNLSSNVNLMELKHSIKGADAHVKLADNEIKLFKKDLYFEVQEVFNNIEFAEKDVPYAQDTAIIAMEKLGTVEKMYNEGKLNYIALQDARKDYITAMEGYIISLNFYNTSLIDVEEALHYHIFDIHHKTQHAITNHSEELIEHLNEALDCNEKELKKNKKHKKNKERL